MVRNRRLSFSFVLIAPVILMTCPAAADQCDALRDPESRIVACTQSINSGKWKGHNQAINYSNRGKAYLDKGDNDRAIADYSRAISLDPKDHEAYYNRGIAYRNKGDFDDAMSDYNKAISLNPKDPDFFNNRAFVYRVKGDFDRAISDYSEAIRLDPKTDLYYARRGRAYFYSGNQAKALADMSQATELDPTDADEALWLEIVGQRSGGPSRLSQAISKIDMTKWPAPMIRLFLGQLTPAAALAAADDPDPAKKKMQVCKANFYGGELSLIKGSKDEATRLFRLAASDCPLDFVEVDAAKLELKALGSLP